MREDLLPRTYEEALIRVIQKASEVTKVVTKLLQYGFTATDERTGVVYDNLNDMMSEFYDLQHAMETIRAYHRARGSVITSPSEVTIRMVSPPTSIPLFK